VSSLQVLVATPARTGDELPGQSSAALEVPAVTLESRVRWLRSRVGSAGTHGLANGLQRLWDDFHAPAGSPTPDSSGVERAGWQVHPGACIGMCLVRSAVGGISGLRARDWTSRGFGAEPVATSARFFGRFVCSCRSLYRACRVALVKL
jgi:hypothetical protein